MIFIFIITSVALAGSEGPSQKWWSSVNPELKSLIEQGLENAPDQKTLQSRVRQADSISRQSRSALLPSIGLNMSATTQPRDAVGFGFGIPNSSATADDTFVSSTAGIRIDMPLDIWGKSYTAWKATKLESLALRSEVNAAELLLSVNVSGAYYDLAHALSISEIHQDQLKRAEELLDLTIMRRDRAEANAVDVLQQKQQVASSQAQLPLSRLQISLQRSRLAALIGKDLNAMMDLSPVMEVSLKNDGFLAPESIVEKLPSVESAKKRSESARLNASSAFRDLFPSLSLNAQITRQGNNLGDQWNTLDAWSGGGGLTMTLFQGGRKVEAWRIALEASKQADEALRKARIEGQREAYDALEGLKARRELLEARRLQLDSAQRAFEEAKRRYVEGITPFLNVISTQQSHYQARLLYRQAERELLGARLLSFVSFGGHGFTREPVNE